MDFFRYNDGELWCEGVPVGRIAAAVGTPAYVYSAETFRHHYAAVAEAFAAVDPIICYAIKSCPNIHICRMLREWGAGFDVVSGGELVRAIEAGGDPAKVVYAGVGKTDEEINRAIDVGIGWFNVESEAELENLIHLAKERGTSVRAALRVNPDVDPKTHRYTSTGKKESKFGVDLERARRVFETYGRHDSVRLCGIHLHIGSPVNTVEPYIEAITKTLDLIASLRANGFDINTLDIGGGFGAHYESSEAPGPAEYAAAIVPWIRDQGLQIIMEPGRSISANAGILLTTTLYLKKSGDRDFLIVDAGMNDLLRPALYEAYHFVWPSEPAEGFVPTERSNAASMPGLIPMDVVGPVCETGDFLAKDRRLPPVRRGDLICLFTAGAYGFSMSSQYNSRPRAAEVLIDGADARLIRRREVYDDLVALERDPDRKGG